MLTRVLCLGVAEGWGTSTPNHPPNLEYQNPGYQFTTPPSCCNIFKKQSPDHLDSAKVTQSREVMTNDLRCVNSYVIYRKTVLFI